MKVCGFEIDAVIDEYGRLRMREESKKGRKKAVFKSPQKKYDVFKTNNTLKSLCKVNDLLLYYKFNPNKHSWGVLLEVVSKFLGKPKRAIHGKRKVSYKHSQTVYEYAYAITYLRLYS